MIMRKWFGAVFQRTLVELHGFHVHFLTDSDLHVLGDWNTVVVGGEVIATNADLISIGLDDDGDWEVATWLDSAVSFILLIQPFLVDVAVAGNMVVLYIHTESKGDGIFRILIIVLGDNIDVEYSRHWGLSIDVNDVSRQDVVKGQCIVAHILGFHCKKWTGKFNDYSYC